MKPYFYISAAGHAVFLAFAVIMATYFAKPRLSYYAIDMLSGSPAPSAAPIPEAAESPVQQEPDVPSKPEPKSVIKEAIKVKEPEKRKLPKPPPPKAAPPKQKPQISGALRSLTGSAPSTSITPQGNTGANVVAEASGPSFPFPWYLKAITDKLDQYWQPPAQFESDTICQVSFTISRDGQISGATLKKSSGDSYFDQLAVRAVQSAGTMPPLPNGFPEESLRVHMKFIGKK